MEFARSSYQVELKRLPEAPRQARHIKVTESNALETLTALPYDTVSQVRLDVIRTALITSVPPVHLTASSPVKSCWCLVAYWERWDLLLYHRQIAQHCKRCIIARCSIVVVKCKCCRLYVRKLTGCVSESVMPLSHFCRSLRGVRYITSSS